MTSPLLHAAFFVFNEVPGLRILNYRDKTVFNDLWLNGLESSQPTIGGAMLDWNDASCRILILGNEPPDEVFGQIPRSMRCVNFREHFTATSWLAAWKLKNSETRARIAIIDCGQADLGGFTSRSLQTLFTAKDASNKPLVPRATVLNAPGLQRIAHWLHETMMDDRTAPAILPNLLKTTIWDALTSEREGHHAISNVLGAFLLSYQVGDGQPHEGDPWMQDYLIKLAQACGTTVHTDPLAGATWISPELRCGIGAAVLVDDMSDNWQHFLRRALGFVGHHQMGKTGRTHRECFVTSRPGKFFEEINALPSRLLRFLDSKKQFLTASDLISGDHGVKDRFVLFLDLRLFSERESNRSGDARKAFFWKIADFGIRLLDSGRHLPWLTVESRNLIRAELQSLLPEAENGKAAGVPMPETLLPRLLSLLDPTLPIVIFSSTHRAELTEPFRNYGNIITAFRKPVLTDMSEDWSVGVNELQVDFVCAMEQADRVLRVRDTFKTFREKADGTEVTESLADKNGYFIEIFLDESERAKQTAICSGGLVVMRPLGRDGSTLVSDTEIRDKLVATGVQWGWCAETPITQKHRPLSRNDYMPKGTDLFTGNDTKDDCAKVAKMVSGAQSAIGEGAICFPIALMDDHSARFPAWTKCPVEIDIDVAEKLMDSSLRRMAGLVLEALVFRCPIIRAALNHPATRLAFDIGTRSYPCREDGVLKDLFGFEIESLPGNRWGCMSFRGSDGYMIVSEVVARTGIHWPFKGSVHRARAVTLRDYGEYDFAWWNEPGKSKVLPKQLHYFADTIANIALHKMEKATDASKELKAFFSSGWIVDLRKAKEDGRINIGRLWDQKNRVASILRAAKLDDQPTGNGIGINVFRELAEGSKGLTDMELKELFRQMPPRTTN